MIQAAAKLSVITSSTRHCASSSQRSSRLPTSQSSRPTTGSAAPINSMKILRSFCRCRGQFPPSIAAAGRPTLYDARAACQAGEAGELALISTCYVAPPASPNGAGKHNALSHAASSHHLSCHIIIIIIMHHATMCSEAPGIPYALENLILGH